MLRTVLSLVVVLMLSAAATAGAAEKLKALVIDGQNNHNWKATTPVIKKAMESSGRFTVDVATSPSRGKDMSTFNPEFSKYDVVVSNYNGAMWSKKTQQAFLDYVNGGGGLVILHAANNSFGGWKEYNQIIGLGGWDGRNQRHGPYVYFKDDKLVRDESKGGGGHHGRQHDFSVMIRNADHPVTKGMPKVWLHVKDELYDKLRGPAVNMTVLATAYASPKTGGSGRHEPMIFTITAGKGRVFHTPMGHADYSMRCAGFQATLNRGAEWAATGKVTQPIPKDFPTADKTSTRK
jgi:type 1 glutamine amidotransferase